MKAIDVREVAKLLAEKDELLTLLGSQAPLSMSVTAELSADERLCKADVARYAAERGAVVPSSVTGKITIQVPVPAARELLAERLDWIQTRLTALGVVT